MAGLFALLDLSSINVVTCPKLKETLVEAVAMQQSPKGHATGAGAILAATATALVNSPLFFFARNRLRHRRTGGADGVWASQVGPKGKLKPSKNMGHSRSGMLNHMRSFRRRTSSSIHMDRRRTSVSSISILPLDDVSRHSSVCFI